MEYQCGNIFMRPNKRAKGEKVSEHMHEFSHVTFFLKGRFQSKRSKMALDDAGVPLKVLTGYNLIDGIERPAYQQVWIVVDDRIFSAGQWCLIEKDMQHEFVGLDDDNEMCCCYSHRDPQSGDVVQDYNGWAKAYE